MIWHNSSVAAPALQHSFALAMGVVAPVTEITQIGGHSLVNLDPTRVAAFIAANGG